MSQLTQVQIAPSGGSVRLAFRSTGLQIAPHASFQAGILTGFLNIAKGSMAAKNEKRLIQVSLSNSASGVFTDVYRSEVIEDAYDISPSLVADIKCLNIFESFIRVRILYVSSLSGGKEVVIGEALLPLNDIVMSKRMRLSMTSQYLKSNAIFEMKVIEPFRDILRHKNFLPIAAANPGNPFKQSYVFYREEGSTAPAVFCEEYGFESRISAEVVRAFLDESLRTLSISKNAWMARKNYEITRQGQFNSLGDALKQGWHQVTISVQQARISSDTEFPAFPSELNTLSINNEIASKDGVRRVSEGPRSGIRKAIQSLGSGAPKGGSKNYDETKPSTFVEVSLLRSVATAMDRVGLTNTEYFTSSPVYGSNCNAAQVKHAHTEHRACRDGITVSSERRSPITASSTDSSPPSSVRTSPRASEDSPSPSDSSAPTFMVYIPERRGTSILFTLNQLLFDTSQGTQGLGPSNDSGRGKLPGEMNKMRVASCSIALDCPSLLSGGTTRDTNDFTHFNINKWLSADLVSSDGAGAGRGAGQGTGSRGVEMLVSIEIISPLSSSMHAGGMRRGTGMGIGAGYAYSSSSIIQHNPSDIFRDCREFELQMGCDGLDPLAHTEMSTAGSMSFLPSQTDLSATPSSVAALSGEGDLISFADFDSPQTDAESNLTTVLTGGNEAGKYGSGTSDPSDFNALSYPPTDYPYPIDWLENHIQQIENLSKEIITARGNVQTLLDKGCTFRPSTAKKIMTHQALPVNLHMQVMAVRSTLSTVGGGGVSSGSRDSFGGQEDGPLEDILDALTCGCLSPHGLGFLQKKGLDAMEGSLYAARTRIDALKYNSKSTSSRIRSQGLEDSESNFYDQEVTGNGDNLTDSQHSGMRMGSVTGGPKAEGNSMSFDVLEKIGKEVLEYETALLSVCKRRCYAVSQAVSIAVSAVLMKLTLVAEQFIPLEVGEGWLTHGFLLIFEGLLSVIGAEKFMLEDTMSAVEALSQYQIRILPSLEGEDDMNAVGLDDLIRFEADHVNKGEQVPRVEVGMKGREVVLYFPPSALNALPAMYQTRARDGGAVLRIVPVLFSQGIDIQQTLALAATSLSSIASHAQADAKAKAFKSPPPAVERDTGAGFGSNNGGAGLSNGVGAGTGAGGVGQGVEDPTAMKNLQYVVNVRGLATLEEYCCRYRPIMDGEKDGDGPAAELSAAVFAKEQHDKYRSSLPSPTAGGGRQGSRAAATTRNLSMAMHLTSAAGSAVKAYGASYFKPNSDLERNGKSNSTSSSNLHLSSSLSLPSHPLLEELTESILSSSNIHSKNVDMLVGVERACVMLGGCRVTFCKSGKDRTGMAVTYEQSRQLGERFGCGQSVSRVLRDANVMRIHGVRIMVAEKNIGRRVYSINQLQAQFLPLVYRPPKEVLEDLMRKDDT